MENKVKYGLLLSDIDNIVSVIKQNKRVNRIVLFGSRAMGSFHKGSDIDISIDGEDLKLNDIIDISIELDKLFLPYKFDMIIWDRIKAY